MAEPPFVFWEDRNNGTREVHAVVAGGAISACGIAEYQPADHVTRIGYGEHAVKAEYEFDRPGHCPVCSDLWVTVCTMTTVEAD